VAVRNLKDERFGLLVVKERDGSDKSGRALWLCQCDCGKTARRTVRVLVRGVSKSCGCLHRQYNQPIVKMVGEEFGRLVVKEFAGRRSPGELLWRCECKCGGEKIATRHSLYQGYTQSCGCLLKEVSRKTLAENRHLGGPKRRPRKSEPPDLPPAPPKEKRKWGEDLRDYKVSSWSHERALAAAGISFA
jgi:hypothetical protein